MRQFCPSVAGVSGALILALGSLGVAAPAAAQQAASAPARYLSWSGKVEPTPAAIALPEGPARRPGLIPRQVTAPMAMAPAPARMAGDARYAPAGNRLTPASAWMGAPSVPHAQPDATPYLSGAAPETTPAYAPPPPPPPPSAQAATAPADAPMSAYAEPPVPSLRAPQPGFEAAFDPMAPRRDAPIFNMGRTPPAPMQAPSRAPAQTAALTAAPSVSPSGPAPTPYAANEPPRQGARYYSVHRAAGHQPDATVMPTAVYLDTAPIDLAEPPETPLPARTINGRARNIAPNEDPSLP